MGNPHPTAGFLAESVNAASEEDSLCGVVAGGGAASHSRGSMQSSAPGRGDVEGVCGVSTAVCGAEAANLLLAQLFPAGTGPPQAPTDGGGGRGMKGGTDERLQKAG